ncbi:hypothetical protein CVT91_08985 [Candidatus Atribacteria bacterium HGW-Atribacteria-1]|nr:MAG: hypothetical protein CVT91_08985 [Candidatus Atribacteria bacterium HGW-Atribacteria-1]
MKNKRVLFLSILTLFLSLLLVGCLPSPVTPTPEPENELPIITSTPITTAIVGFVYSYDVQATDPDGDTLTYTLSIAPSGMNIDYPTGIVSWSPSSLQLGDNEVVVRVSDGTSSVTQSFIITVSLIGRLLESIEVLPETMELSVAQSLSITSVTATYDDEETAVVALANCTYVSDPTGIVSVVDGVITGLAVGTTTITVSYTEVGVTQTDTVEVTVIPRVLESITVLPATMTLFVGQPQAISVTANYNFGTANIALTNPNCTYVSDDPSIASVAAGVITGESVGGPVTITVTYEEGGVTETDTVEVTVVLAYLTITPPSQTVTVGSQATINIVVATIPNLKGASITLNFDATKLQYASSADGGFIPGAFLPSPTVDNTNGSVVLDIASLTGSASGTGTIITVIFDTIASGSSNITFGTTLLRDENNDPIYHTTSSGCSVTIN